MTIKEFDHYLRGCLDTEYSEAIAEYLQDYRHFIPDTPLRINFFGTAEDKAALEKAYGREADKDLFDFLKTRMKGDFQYGMMLRMIENLGE